MSRSLKKMSSDLDTKYSKFNKDSPGVVSDLLLQLEVRPSGGGTSQTSGQIQS